jgi:pentatricopeptide repeat protein
LTLKSPAPRDIKSCNINILEACQAGDPATAWRIYDSMRAWMLKPDVYTYSILLNDAKKRDDVAAMEQMLSEAGEEGLLSQSPFMAADHLHAIYLWERKREDGGTPFTTMLSTYRMSFHVQPLKDLGLLPEHYHQPPLPNLMQPPPPPLGMMIIAFLAEFDGRLTCEALFNRYCDHINHGHPTISLLAATDYAANAYLMGLGRQLRTLHLCTSVIQYMLRPSKMPAAAAHRGDVVMHATPTVQTWSILLAAFLRHGQRLAANKVLSMMRSKGLKPNLVTWNTLISGHAKLQDVDGALSALRGLKEDGFEMDDYTLKGLGRIRDRRRLVEALQESDELEEIEESAASLPTDGGGEQVAVESDQSRPQKVVLTSLASLRGG